MNEPLASPASIQPDGEGEQLQARGTRIVVKVSSPRVSVTDHVLPAGSPGPPLHVHPAFDEVFVVLDGMLTMRVRDQVYDVAPAATAFVEGSIPHTFANTSEAPVRFMTVMTPGGFEDYFRAMAAGEEHQAMALASQRFGYAPALSE